MNIQVSHEKGDIPLIKTKVKVSRQGWVRPFVRLHRIKYTLIMSQKNLDALTPEQIAAFERMLPDVVFE